MAGGMTLRVAMFPRGGDGLYLPSVTGVEVLALVARGAPEEAWVRGFIAPERVLTYTFTGDRRDPYPATDSLLRDSDIHRCLERAGVRGLLMSASTSAATQAWSRRHRITLIASDYAQQRRLEDKIWLHRFLGRHGLPRPSGGVFTYGSRGPRLRGPQVLQVPDSMGGEGTYFIAGPAELARLGLQPGRRYLLRERIVGRPFGITVFVAPQAVALSAVRLQCYHPEPRGAARCFAGVQWFPSAWLSPRLRRRIDAVFAELGELLYRRRFLGFANFDFMVDEDDEIHVLECNPRMSAATPQLLARPELLGGVPAGALFLAGFTGPRRYARGVPRCSRVPDTGYRGATLDVVPAAAGAVTRGFQSGRYVRGAEGVRYHGADPRGGGGAGALTLLSFARPGQVCGLDSTLATVLADEQLYDRCGGLLARALQLLAHFGYTA